MKIVFDTNVLLAGIFTRGVCEAVLDACLLSPSHAVFASEYILSEFVDRAIVKFKIPANQADDAIRFLRSQITVVQPAPVPNGSCRDPNDLPILGTALSAQAEYLVTGDGDLLELKAFNAIPIIAPRALHELLYVK